MAKIIKIKDGIISIGTDDGRIDEVRFTDLEFFPQVGDEVEIFRAENQIIVTKIEERANSTNSGININVQNTNSVPQQAYQQSFHGKAVNKVIYCVLAFVLGGLGAHKFYSGRIAIGFVYLLFCWTYIPAIVGLIEAIIGLTKTSDDNGMIIV